jgi:outer membrane protein OmpA-like peptidoglycan-associated protein
MDAMNARSLIAPLAVLLLSQCSLLERAVNSSAVIYALAPQEKMPSPLDPNSGLTQAGATITFSPNRYLLTARQRSMITTLAKQWQDKTPQVLVLGTARRGTPAGYARSLSQRRAESVRQALIEEGLDAAKFHSAGYGHDQPSISTEDAVKLMVVP